MTYMSDRQRVESALPAHLMLSVVLNGASDQDGEDTRECLSLLRMAAMDAVEDLPTVKEREKILRRSERLYRECALPWSGEGQSVAKFGLIVYYWLRAMVDQGYVQIADGSYFDQAMEIVLPALQPSAEIEGVDRSAQKQSTKFHARLQDLGYYRQVNLNG